MAEFEVVGRRLCNISELVHEEDIALLAKGQSKDKIALPTVQRATGCRTEQQSDQSSKEQSFPWTKRISSRPGLEAKWRLLTTSFLLASVATLCASIAMAEESNESSALSDSIYVLHLEPVQPFDPIGAPLILESGPSFGADSSPTGVILPDTFAYFNLDSTDGELTYLTPRVQGLQLSWTGDLSTSPEPNGSKGVSSQTYVSRPTSVGANFTQGSDDFQVTLGADYGRTPKSVPGAVRLVNDQKLLRVGAHVRIAQFTLGAAFGNDVDPDNLGETLSWDVFGRYDFGALAIGFVYNYTAEAGGGGMPGTIQGGVSYFFMPQMAVSANLAYGSYEDQGGREDLGVAGVLGLSLIF